MSDYSRALRRAANLVADHEPIRQDMIDASEKLEKLATEKLKAKTDKRKQDIIMEMAELEDTSKDWYAKIVGFPYRPQHVQEF